MAFHGLGFTVLFAVQAADPAAWAARAAVHFVAHDDDVFGAGFWLCAGYGPAYPFVSCERRYIFPHLPDLLIGQNGFLHVVGQLMDRAALKCFL